MIEYLFTLPLKTHVRIRFIIGVVALVCVIAGLYLFFPRLMVLLWIGFALLVVGIIWGLVFIRCPHCGRGLFPRSVTPYCPYCGEQVLSSQPEGLSL